MSYLCNYYNLFTFAKNKLFNQPNKINLCLVI
jgi:hypothetical protein